MAWTRPDTASGARVLESIADAFTTESTLLHIEQGLIADALGLLVGVKLATRVRAKMRSSAATRAASERSGSDVWSRPPVKRGRAIERALSTNLPDNFPVIDRFNKGIATSIKSIDLRAASYQNPKALTRTVTRYIDKVGAGRDAVPQQRPPRWVLPLDR